MGIFNDVLGFGSGTTSFENDISRSIGVPTFSELIGGITGSTQANAALEGAAAQERLGREGIGAIGAAQDIQQGINQPFTDFGTSLLPQAQSFISDPNAQFDFLQNNPLFDLSLQNANQQTSRNAAAGGRLSFGSTAEDFANNVLLSAQPLLQQQSQNLFQGIGVGQRGAQIQGGGAALAGGQIADLLTQIGNAQSAGGIGAANAESEGIGNIANIAGSIFGGLSDERAKNNINIVGQYKDLNIITWDWKESVPESLRWGNKGFSAQEVNNKYPQYVSEVGGYLTVDMQGLISHLEVTWH